MSGLREILDHLPLPPAVPAPGRGYALPAAHLLSAELPQGHLHVWSAPPSAGKTAFLLGLVLEAARRGRGGLLATYDLPAPTLALRLLAMESGVPLADFDGTSLPTRDLVAISHARARLAELPIEILEARGLTVASLEDRLVRSPRRFDVLGVDFAEAVVRPADQPLATTFRALAALAQRRWVAVVAIARTAPVERAATVGAGPADRVGWLEPLGERGACEATILANRHGERPSCRLRLDPVSGRWVAGDVS